MLGIRKRRPQAGVGFRVTNSDTMELVLALLRTEDPALVVLVERTGELNLWEDVSSPAEVVRMLREIADKYEHDCVVEGVSGAPSASPEGAQTKESTDG